MWQAGRIAERQWIVSAACYGPRLPNWGSLGDLEAQALAARPSLVPAAAVVQRNNEASTDMVKTPKKMKDPTEAALSAIQDALQIRDTDIPKDASGGVASSPMMSDEP